MSIQDKINAAMESAHDSGHTFIEWTYRDIADDLVTLDASLESNEPEQLIEPLKKWFRESNAGYLPYIN